MMKKKEIKFEIIEHIATISKSDSGWSKELNKVSWNDSDVVYDIRSWNEDHTKCGKGITLSNEEYNTLKEVLQ